MESFGGPSILSRGGGRLGGGGGGDPLRIRGFASLLGTLDGGLSNVTVDETGAAPTTNAYGAMIGLGAGGGKNWRHSMLSMNYRGNYRAYDRTGQSFNGSDQSLGLAFAHQLNPRWLLFVNQSAGVRSTAFGTFGTTFDPNVPAPEVLSDEEIFDNKMYFLGSSAGFNYRATGRLVFSGTGGASVIRRHSQALSSVNGYRASGQATYTLSPRSQIGGGYQFSHFYFPRGFGETDVNSYMVFYARRLSPRWSTSLGGGYLRTQSQRLQRVGIDPAIAALIGQAFTLEIFDGSFGTSSVQASLSGNYRRQSVSTYYSRGVNPGNGVLVSSLRENLGATYTFNGTRRWHISANGRMFRFKPITQVGPVFRGYSVGTGTNYRLTSYMHLSGRAAYTYNEMQNGTFARERYRLSLGITFASGEIPLALW